MGLHLLVVPAVAHAEQEPPAGDDVERGDLLGQPQRIALGDERDPRAEHDRVGDRRRRGEGDELVVGAPVELGQRRRAGLPAPRRAPRRRDVRVLGEPQRVEATGLGLAGDLDGLDAEVGGEDGQAEAHGGYRTPVGTATVDPSLPWVRVSRTGRRKERRAARQTEARATNRTASSSIASVPATTTPSPSCTAVTAARRRAPPAGCCAPVRRSTTSSPTPSPRCCRPCATATVRGTTSAPTCLACVRNSCSRRRRPGTIDHRRSTPIRRVKPSRTRSATSRPTPSLGPSPRSRHAGSDPVAGRGRGPLAGARSPASSAWPRTPSPR